MIEDVLIVGLGETGASIALALTQAGFGQTRTGFDPVSQHARAMRKAGVVQRLALNLERSAPQADVVILTVPSGDAMAYLEALGPRLKGDGLLLDLSSIQAQAAPWAAANIPQGRHYIGGYLSANAQTLLGDQPPGPRADLFRDGEIGLAIPPQTPASAVERALAVATHLGARPLFLEPGEIDGVSATVDDLPAVLGAALMRVASQTPGWREARRLAGRAFASVAVHGAMRPGEELQAALRGKPLATADRLDRFIQELQAFRHLLADPEAESELGARLAQAAQAFDAWHDARLSARWAEEERGAVELPERTSVVERLLGFGQPLRPKDRR